MLPEESCAFHEHMVLHCLVLLCYKYHIHPSYSLIGIIRR